MSSVGELKAQGNRLIAEGDFKKAAVAYTQALKLEPNSVALLTNRAVAFLKLGRASRALEDADAALRLDATSIKAHFRRLQALQALQATPEQLLECARAAHALDATAAEFVAVLCKHDASFVAPTPPPAAPAPKPKPKPNKPTSAVLAASAPQQQSQQSHSPIDASFKQDNKFVSSQEMPSAVLEFVQKTVDEVLTQFESDVLAKAIVGAKLRATAFLLPLHDVPMPVINIDRAFENPDDHGKCIEFLRETAQREQALGACVVVQRSSISFPQVWSGRARSEFPFAADVDGIFICFESATVEGAAQFSAQRFVHFMPMLLADAPNSKLLRIAKEHVVALDPDLFAITPRILK